MKGQHIATNRTAAFAAAAFVICALFHFGQYAVRSAPGIMVEDLTHVWKTSAVGVGTVAAAYYYTYSLTSVVAGVSLDRWGANAPVPIGCSLLALGCYLFGIGDFNVALAGRLLQGAGAAFAFTGVVFVAARAFPPEHLAFAVGVAQAFGMLGGVAGQSGVAFAVHRAGVPTAEVWIALAASLAVLACALAITLRYVQRPEVSSIGKTLRGLAGVLLNPQSYLCGICAGLLFVPTTIGDMIWRVSFMTRGLGLEYEAAVSSAAMVPLGWVIGAPLLGWISDRLGRRKPVLIVSAITLLALDATVLFSPVAIASNWAVSLAFGVVSGAAMIPYTIIKEVNEDRVKGSATGAMNFMVFALSALIAPLFGWIVGHHAGESGPGVVAFRDAGVASLASIAIAAICVIALKETGHAADPAGPIRGSAAAAPEISG